MSSYQKAPNPQISRSLFNTIRQTIQSAPPPEGWVTVPLSSPPTNDNLVYIGVEDGQHIWTHRDDEQKYRQEHPDCTS